MKPLLLDRPLVLGFVFLMTVAACPSRSFTYTAGNAISPSEVTTNEQNAYNYLCAGVDTYANLSIPTASIANNAVTEAKLATGAVTTTVILDGTIASADIADNTITADDLNTTLTLSDGDLIDLDAINVSSTTEGLLLPQATSCTSGTAEGQVCWDTDNDVLYVGTASAAQAVANPGTPALTLSTTNSAGTASTVVRTDATIAAFDATVPVTQAFGNSAATGSAAVAARRDHTHGMPTPTYRAVIATIESVLTTETDYSMFGVSGTSATISLPVPFTGTMRNLYVYVNNSASGSIVVTYQDDDVDSALTCTVATTAKTCSDTSNSVAVTAADRMTFEITNNRNATLLINVSAELDSS